MASQNANLPSLLLYREMQKNKTLKTYKVSIFNISNLQSTETLKKLTYRTLMMNLGCPFKCLLKGNLKHFEVANLLILWDSYILNCS